VTLTLNPKPKANPLSPNPNEVPRRAARLYLTRRQWKDAMQDFIGDGDGGDGGDGDGGGTEGAEEEEERLATTASALEQSEP
jgi:hypothetical protein